MTKNVVNGLEKKIINVLSKNAAELSQKEISRMLNITKRNHNIFQKAIYNLKSNGKIIRIKKLNKFKISPMTRIIRNELIMTRSGFGFVKDEESGQDVFIGRDHLNTALNGDLVEVKLYARRRGKNEEGFVSKLIERKRQQFVGTFHQTQYYGYVVPDDPKIYRDFFIAKEKQNGAKNGQKVVVLLEKWETDHLNPEGEIIEVIGYPGEAGVDVASVVHSFQLGIKFPQAVDLEAKNILHEISIEEIKNRRDLRNLVCLTIDPEDAKDFDDAVSLQILKNGNYLLGVHIADVSYYVKENSKIDQEALKRGTSIYLVDRVVPMLPELLSNELCSLKPNQDKLTFSCFMEINTDCDIVDYEIKPSIINSKRRFTYEQVQQIIEDGLNDEFYALLNMMRELSKKITRKRLDEGGIDFETPEVSFELDEKGFPTAIKRRQRLDSHRLIEEFMLLANKTVAKHIFNISTDNKRLPFVFRVHEKPDREKMEKFFIFLKAIGHKFKPVKKVTSKYFQGLLKSIKGLKEEIVIEEVALRSMMKAVYSTNNAGHFGLGFEHYTHFTSPIRRYPDLVVHRLLKKYMSDSDRINTGQLQKNLSAICEQASRMERTALEAERESIRIKKNEYISQHIGSEFQGVISGVMSFGIFVELIDTLVEGLVHIQDIKDDYYIYDESSFSLIGRDTNRVLRLGDEVEIKVKKVNLEEGKVDFSLVN